MNSVVVALDVGGTSIKAALVRRGRDVVLEVRRPTGVQLGPDAVVDGILALARDLVQMAKTQVSAVGIGVPGIVDPVAGIARHAVNLGWRDVPLVDLIGRHTGVAVVLGNDVRAAALAEARIGAGVGAQSMYFLAIGTGIAGGMVANGTVDNGVTGLSGEVGHLIVRPGGPSCRCGNSGCLETVASASRISDTYASVTGERCSARRIADMVRAGKPAAQMVWHEAVSALADALAAVTVLIDPGRFVIGGGLSLAGDTLTEPLTAALARRLTFRPPPPILLSTLGDQAGMLGAAIQAWDHLDATSAPTQ